MQKHKESRQYMPLRVSIMCWSLALMIFFLSFILNWSVSSYGYIMGTIGAVPIGIYIRPILKD